MPEVAVICTYKYRDKITAACVVGTANRGMSETKGLRPSRLDKNRQNTQLLVLQLRHLSNNLMCF